MASRKTDCLIFLFCMRRSGSHAIVNFLFRLFDDPKIFYAQKAPQSKLETRKKDVIQGRYKGHSKLTIVRYEEKRLMPYSKPLVENWDETVGKVGETFNFIQTRDPFNFFASRYKTDNKWMKLTPNRKNKLVRKWKAYARAALGIDNILDNLIHINYNSWLTDQVYRMQIAGLVKRPFKDNEWNRIDPKRGQKALRSYSSFSGNEKVSYADPNDLLSRWVEFKDDEFFRSIFEDKDLWELSEQLYGHMPGTEYLKNG